MDWDISEARTVFVVGFGARSARVRAFPKGVALPIQMVSRGTAVHATRHARRAKPRLLGREVRPAEAPDRTATLKLIVCRLR